MKKVQKKSGKNLVKKDFLNCYLSQSNPIVGDLDGNANFVKNEYFLAAKQNADLIIFSELNLTGYPPEDLLNKKYFIDEARQKIKEICAITKGEETAILLGAPILEKSALYNCALLISHGKIQKIIKKITLPNYGVFDEKRYFATGDKPTIVDFKGFNLAVLICEDIWNKENSRALKGKKIDVTISLNASPFSQKKIAKRLAIAKDFAKTTQAPLIYVNQVGGQDSIIFDGNSFVADKTGKMALKMRGFAVDKCLVQIAKKDKKIIAPQNSTTFIEPEESSIYQCLVLGLRDYIQKSNFKKVALGMSGGIDSALVATIAVDALGSENVKLIALPSKYNSKQSFIDAQNCAKNLGIQLETIEIESAFKAMISTLENQFKNTKPDLTEENLQSRIRGLLLMAISNKFGNLLLSTGNKSELAVGYATIYGDMCGAFNPLKDIYKTEVFALSKWRNANIPAISRYQQKNLIPDSIITKAPSAELRDNQKDSDSLPEYDVLDTILYKMIEEEKSIAQIIKETKFDAATIKRVAKLFYFSEYKRRQAVIGPKVSKMSFDRDRRYPITNKFHQ